MFDLIDQIDEEGIVIGDVEHEKIEIDDLKHFDPEQAMHCPAKMRPKL